MNRMSIRNWDSLEVIDLADANPDGFTVDIMTGKRVTSGYAVAMTHGLTPEDAAVIANLVSLGAWMPSSIDKWTIGGWRDGDKYIIDIGFVTRWEESAIALGKHYNQDAIYNLNTNECITLKGE